MFSGGGDDGARVGVRVGDSVLDLARALGDEVFGEPSLNAFMAQGRIRWTEARATITELLTAGQQDERHRGAAEAALRPLSAVRLHLPFVPGDYVDFFGNEYHAANAGRIFRPDGEPLTPNWKHMPIGYHGRSGTIVPSGTPVTRPCGQRRGADGPTFGPSQRLAIYRDQAFSFLASRLGHQLLEPCAQIRQSGRIQQRHFVAPSVAELLHGGVGVRNNSCERRAIEPSGRGSWPGVGILTGDNVYFRENVEKNLPPNIVLAYKPDGFYRAYEWIRMLMARSDCA